jgi:hypothetical protein
MAAGINLFHVVVAAISVSFLFCKSVLCNSNIVQPHEMEHLMNILDEDNGGTIEKEEFLNFWNSS